MADRKRRTEQIGMTWAEKVRALTPNQRLVGIEKAAGWARGTLSNALTKGTMPAADKGIQLARVLHVSAEWLFDPSIGMPPPDSLGNLIPPADWNPDDWKALRRVVQALRQLEPEDDSPRALRP